MYDLNNVSDEEEASHDAKVLFDLNLPVDVAEIVDESVLVQDESAPPQGPLPVLDESVSAQGPLDVNHGGNKRTYLHFHMHMIILVRVFHWQDVLKPDFIPFRTHLHPSPPFVLLNRELQRRSRLQVRPWLQLDELGHGIWSEARRRGGARERNQHRAYMKTEPRERTRGRINSSLFSTGRRACIEGTQPTQQIYALFSWKRFFC